MNTNYEQNLESNDDSIKSQAPYAMLPFAELLYKHGDETTIGADLLHVTNQILRRAIEESVQKLDAKKYYVQRCLSTVEHQR